MDAEARVDEAHGRAASASLAGAQARERAAHEGVERGLPPEGEVQLLGAREDLGQLGVELRGREGRVGAVVAHGALDARAAARPRLGGRIARPHEHDERRLGVARPEHERRARLGEPGEMKRMSLSWRNL